MCVHACESARARTDRVSRKVFTLHPQWRIIEREIRRYNRKAARVTSRNYYAEGVSSLTLVFCRDERDL